MFAIAIWDENQEALWLIRDRSGIKPLYYSVHHGRIVFASEINAARQRLQGCRVIGIDPDRARVAMATSLGMEHAQPSDDAELDAVSRLTDGYGADGVIITAATPSNSVVSSAFKMCRKSGRPASWRLADTLVAATAGE